MTNTLSREKIIDLIATEIQCSDMLSECDDFERTVRGLVWGTRIYEVLEKNGPVYKRNSLVANLVDALCSCIEYGVMTGDDWVKDKAISAIKEAEGE